MRVAMIGMLVLAAACGSGTGPNTGKLTVTVTAPTGITPTVAVTGPNGYSKALTATTTLSGLASGSYRVAAASVTATNPIVGTLYTATVSGSPARASSKRI
jgi:hypothetical protein